MKPQTWVYKQIELKDKNVVYIGIYVVRACSLAKADQKVFRLIFKKPYCKRTEEDAKKFRKSMYKPEIIKNVNCVFSANVYRNKMVEVNAFGNKI